MLVKISLSRFWMLKNPAKLLTSLSYLNICCTREDTVRHCPAVGNNTTQHSLTAEHLVVVNSGYEVTGCWIHWHALEY